ncbi:alpha/beta fold hydrolase [Mameliella alba]|uniref:alpha/beta fold hydrolase n=1 Tax=Mameliella alba TaxID=561184 RepID=UPI000B537EE4|nr:alpha/beta fold hydrolase [Mameliella alba]OWV46264.1 alpha/beta hydrolase [Mameliella alba]GGF74924.1 O-methylpimelyl-ACP methylesterase [Mameliella alba]
MRHPLIFLHGWTMRGAVFDGIVGRLSPEFACFAPDLPGHGKAAHLPPDIDSCAEVLADCIASCGAERPVIIGWSMGAATAWRYIAQHGTAGISGLVTVDMSPRVMPAPDWPHGLRGETQDSVAAARRRFDSDWEGVTHGIAATMFASREGATGLSRQKAQALIVSHDPDKMRALWDDLLAFDERAVIPLIDVPYLVCSGAQSRVYAEGAAAWLCAHAPQARRHVFRQSGHSPHLEEPEAFADTIAHFARAVTD